MIDFERDDIRQFADIWSKRPPSPMTQTKAAWDKRAERWEKGLRKDTNYRANADARIVAAVEFLRKHGVLTEGQDVIDIGCGPGRFAAAFAPYVNHVTGTDLSSGMVEYAAAFSAELGLKNTEFISGDFSRMDIDRMGWRGRFDLTFASITPAVSTLADLEKMMAMSRRWCFYGGFRSRGNDMEARVAELFGMAAPMSHKDGRSAYGLMNMLWLSGYDPIVEYFYEEKAEAHRAGRAYAAQLADRMGFRSDEEEKIGRIESYLAEQADEEGLVHTVNRSTYVWLLWDRTRCRG